jgi:hypothetical protein
MCGGLHWLLDGIKLANLDVVNFTLTCLRQLVTFRHSTMKPQLSDLNTTTSSSTMLAEFCQVLPWLTQSIVASLLSRSTESRDGEATPQTA